MNYQKAITSPASFIYIIECLSENELKTGTSRRNMILDTLIAKKDDQYKKYHKLIMHKSCQDLAQFIAAFDDIAEICKAGDLPHIYIDAHGDPQKGLRLPSGDYVSWTKQLSIFNKITTITKGELTVFSLFCYSMNIIKSLTNQGRLPFSFYFGYEKEVTAKTIENESFILLDQLLDPSNFSMKATLESLSLSCYSEYDNVKNMIAVLHSMRNNPQLLSLKNPTLSKSRIISTIERELAQNGRPLSGMHKTLNEIIKSDEFIKEIFGEHMHDTQRLADLVTDFIRSESPN